MIVEQLKKQSREYGISFWLLPDVLLLIMAAIDIFVMIVSYVWFASRQDPGVVIVIVAIESASILVLGNLIVENSKKIVSVNKLKKEFVQIISHQMRTPISSISWSIERMKKDDYKGMNIRQISCLESIADANKKTMEIVNDILNLIFVENKDSNFSAERIDLAKIIFRVLDDFKSLASMKKVSVTFSRKTPCFVVGDEARLRVVIENILENAIKYNKKGGKVGISIKKEGEEIILKIADTGIGIDQGDKQFIFNKFYRGKKAASSEAQGTGLGLFIGSKMMQRMNGDIWFKERKGGGTEFFVSVPVFSK